MKKIMIASVCAAFVLGSYAQEAKKEEIPAATKSAFAAKYPKATKVEWSVEKPGEFEVEFKSEGNEMAALYDANGVLIETEVEVKEKELPQGVQATMAKELAGYKFDEFEKATDAKGYVTYEFEAEKGKETLKVVIDAAGKLIKKEAKEEEKDEEKGKKEDKD